MVEKTLGRQNMSKYILWRFQKNFSAKSENPACPLHLFDFGSPLKISILKNFKIIVETSLIAHSIGNFILKNIKKGTILTKLISDGSITKNSNMTSQNHTWRHISSDMFYQHSPFLMFFSIKFPIEWAINEVFTIILKFWHQINFPFIRWKSLDLFFLKISKLS